MITCITIPCNNIKATDKKTDSVILGTSEGTVMLYYSNCCYG